MRAQEQGHCSGGSTQGSQRKARSNDRRVFDELCEGVSWTDNHALKVDVHLPAEGRYVDVSNVATLVSDFVRNPTDVVQLKGLVYDCARFCNLASAYEYESVDSLDSKSSSKLCQFGLILIAV